MGDHVPDGSDECATDPALTTQDRRRRRGSGGVRPADEDSEALAGGVLVPPEEASADRMPALGLVGRVVGAVEGEVAEAVNWASILFSQELLVGVQATSALWAAAHAPTRWQRMVVKCGEQLSQTIAMLTSAGCSERR